MNDLESVPRVAESLDDFEVGQMVVWRKGLNGGWMLGGYVQQIYGNFASIGATVKGREKFRAHEDDFKGGGWVVLQEAPQEPVVLTGEALKEFETLRGLLLNDLMSGVTEDAWADAVQRFVVAVDKEKRKSND